MPTVMGIGRRLSLVFLVMLPVIVGPVVLALWEIGKLRSENGAQAAAVTHERISASSATGLVVLASDLRAYGELSGATARRALRAEIETGIVDGEQALGAAGPAAGAGEQAAVLRVLTRLWRSGAVERAATSPAARSALAVRLDGVEASAARVSSRLLAGEAARARTAARADGRHASAVRLAAVAVIVLGVLIGAGCLLWLARVVLPRTRRYADFADRVVAGETREPLRIDGDDELGRLGQALNAMVATGERDQRSVETQAEYGDALQVASSEEEAHAIIKLHLERSFPGSEAAVLNRNNSADRLELKTVMSDASPLAEAVRGAEPRSCLAVRFARVHEEGAERRPLLTCDVCGGTPGTKTCNPLLVGGEVIGSVLVTSEGALDASSCVRLQQTVFQAAPVLANLRNLAIAELRAATDALTGLPNNRAVRDTVKRMAAQAGRTTEPLTAAMLDLDHFKQINDTFGHARGDDVLATVAAVMRETLRDSDFVGRLGGEEFIILLPATAIHGAVPVAEKLRAALAEITVPGVDRDITASIGLAAIPEHAGDADALLRAADRALYAAKAGGRNRVEVSLPSEAAAQRDVPGQRTEPLALEG